MIEGGGGEWAGEKEGWRCGISSVRGRSRGKDGEKGEWGSLRGRWGMGLFERGRGVHENALEREGEQRSCMALPVME